MPYDYFNRINPKLDEYKLWLTDKLEPMIDSPYPFPPWFTPGTSEYTTTYSLNNDGHRCDDFTNPPPKNHILFAGCENTVPIGLPIKFGWANIVYRKTINEDGNFRLIAYPGGSISKVVANLFKYFNNYGNPTKLYILMPELARDYGCLEEEQALKPKIYRQYYLNERDTKEHNLNCKPNDYPLELLGLRYIQQARILEQYCKIANIELNWTSWDNSTNNFLKNFDWQFFKYTQSKEGFKILSLVNQAHFAKFFLN
jgi:hypothetical protein